MDATPGLLISVAVALVVAVPASAARPDPDVLQARYDAARDAEDRALARGDRAAALRARRDVLWAERHDSRPRTWHLTREIPALPLPRRWAVARRERATDRALTARLALIGRSYSGWAAFWTHDLRTGRTAGWNADASFPAASTVKLGVLAAGLSRFARPERSRAWYELRQLTGWSSNLATNRLVRMLGREAAVVAALRRLGARASTYPGPYRAGTSRTDVTKPPPHRHWRVTTAHDLGRMLYALHAAAAGNRWLQHRTRLSRHQAQLALALLATGSRAGENGGVVAPFLGRAVIAQKTGWLSDTRATAALVYRRSSPRIVVVLAYRPGIRAAEARSLGRRAVEAVLTG